MKTLLIALALASVATASQAASFDCGRARAPDERAICANLALNDKDVRMSVLYEVNRRTLAMGGRDALIGQQRDWLAERRNCGANRACLNRAYDRRLAELERSMDRIYRNAPF
ncbi:MAG: hypothetical protein J7521_01405 [Caulobacter sp.]|nr:hypothetical protein [Caulobacter sp.]